MPLEPVITGFTTDTGTQGDNRTADRSLTFTGTGTPGASLELTDVGPDGSSGIGTLAFISSIPASGIWSVTIGDGGNYPAGSDGELPDGVYYITAGSRDAGGASSRPPAIALTVDGPEMSAIDLTAGSDTGPSNNDNYTADQTPTIEFTAGAGDTLGINWDDGRGFVAAGTGTGASQTVTLDQAYPASSPPVEKNIQVRATKEGVSTTEQITITFDRETILPRGTIRTEDDSGFENDDRLTNVTQPILTGTGEVGATIEIRLTDGSGPVLASTTVAGDGTWTVQVPNTLDDGEYPLAVRAVDLAGNSTQLNGGGFTIDTVAPAAATITSFNTDTGVSSSDGITNDNSLSMGGATEANSIVRVYANGVEVAVDTTTSTGSWFKSLSTLTDGTYTITAVAEDLAGNVGAASAARTVVIDTVRPDVGTIDLDAVSDSNINNDNITNEATWQLSGTGSPGGEVKLQLNNADLKTVIADGNGNWMTTVAAVTGNYTVSAFDVAGNTSLSRNSVTITYDNTNPELTSVDLISSSDGGSSQFDNITNVTAPTFTGAIPGNESGAEVAIYADGVLIGTAVSASNGSWNVTSSVDLDDGDYDITAIVTDQAGNESGVGPTLGITIDTVAQAPVITGFSNDTGAADGITSDNTPLITGTADAGANVTLYVDMNFAGTAVADEFGAWQVQVNALDVGEHVFTAQARDVAGNTANTSSNFNITVTLPTTAAPVVTGITEDTGTDGDGITSDTTLTVDGTAPAGSTVTVSVNGAVSGTTTVAQSGVWSYDIAATLADGDYAITATAQSSGQDASAASAAFDVVVDTVDPVTPTIDLRSDSGRSASDNITNDTALVFEGTAEVGTTLELFDGDTKLNDLGLVDGSWSTILSLSPGDHSLSVRSTDAAGNVTDSAALDVTVDRTAPATPVITSFSEDTGLVGDGITTDRTLTLSGTAEPDAIVSINYNFAQFFAETTADGEGNWTVTGESLADGTYDFHARATDVAGNSSNFGPNTSVTIQVNQTAAPVITAISDDTGVDGDGVTSDTNLFISGTAAAGATVEVFAVMQGGGGSPSSLGTTVADEFGAWTLDATDVTFGFATFDLTATAQGLDELKSEVSTAYVLEVDLAAPSVPVITGFVSDSGVQGDQITNSTTLVISGTGEVGATILLSVDGNFVNTTTVNEAGTWSALTGNLPEGGHSFIATSSDLAGNASAASTPFGVIVDTTPPEAPVVTGISDDTGVPGDGVTSDGTLVVFGTAQPLTKVVVSLDYGSTRVADTVTSDGNGDWSYDFSGAFAINGDFNIAEGQTRAFAQAVDAAGNMSAPSVDFVIVRDATAPDAPTVTLNVSTDSGVQGDGITSDTTPLLEGTAEPESTIEIRNGTVLLGSAVVDGDGNWTFVTPELAEGAQVLNVVSVDLAGNTSEAAELSLTIDSIAPVKPTIDLAAESDNGISDTDNITNDATPTLQGTAEAFATVDISYTHGRVLGTANADLNGNWTFTVPGERTLSNGASFLHVSTRDDAGNLSVSDALRVDVDTTLPSIPTIELETGNGTDGGPFDQATSDTTPTFSGFAEEGTTIELFADNGDSVLVGTTTASDEQWLITASELGEGVYSMTVRSTDTAGNVRISDALGVTIDTTAPAAAPTITGITPDTGALSDDGVTSDLAPVVQGTATPNSQVHLTINFVQPGEDGRVTFGTREAVVDVDRAGNWTYAHTLGEASITLAAVEVDAAGNEGPQVFYSYVVDQTAPDAPVFTGLAFDSGTQGDNITNDDTPTISGTAEAGSSVQITRDGDVIETIAVGGFGNAVGWSFTSTELEVGTYQFAATATDPAGNVSGLATSSVQIVPAVGGVPAINFILDTGARGDDAVTNINDQRAFGTGIAGELITVSLDGDVLGTVEVPASGDWSFTFPATLDDGDYVLTATATPAGGVASAASPPFAITIDTVTPEQAIIDLEDASDSGVSNTDNLTNEDTLVVTIMAEVGSRLNVRTGEESLANRAGSIYSVIGDQPPVNGAGLIYSGIVDESGQVRIDLGPQPDGPVLLSVDVTDLAGNTSENTLTIVVDTVAPAAAVIDGIGPDTGASATDDVTSASVLEISGTAEAGASVELFNGVSSLGTTVALDGLWSVETAALADGSYGFSAVVTDAAGNISAPSAVRTVVVDTQIAVPTLALADSSDTNIKGDNITASRSQTVEGTGEAGSTIVVRSGTDELDTVTVDPDGTWSAELDLDEGTSVLTVSSTDAAGNFAVSAPLSITVDLTAPGRVTIDLVAADDTGISDTDNITSNTAPNFTGTAEAGSTLQVAITAIPSDGSDAVLQRDDVVVGEDGTWSLTAPELTGSVYQMLVQPVDAAGNVGAQYSLTFQIDTATSDVSVLGTFSVDTGLDGDGITSDNTPVFSGTAEFDSQIAVLRNGVEVDQVTVTTGGSWTYTSAAIADGEYDFTFQATDVAGNMSAVSAATTVVVDTVVAAPTIDLAAASDGGAADDDNITNVTAPVITGTAEAGSTLQVALLVQDSSFGQSLDDIVVGQDGTWSLPTQDFAEGDNVLIVSAVDVAGNTSNQTRLEFTIDTTAPSVPDQIIVTDDTGTANDRITSDTTPTFTGKARGASEVAVLLDGVEVGRVSVSAFDDWSFTSDALADGPHGFTFQSSDLAGNVSFVSSAITLNVDTVAPDAPTITGLSSDSNFPDGVTLDQTPTLGGTAEVGTTVTLLRDGVIVATTVAAANGRWSVTSAVLADGDYSYTATTTDAAGNVSAASAAMAVTIDATAPDALTLSNNSVDENSAGGTVVGTVLTNEDVTLRLSDDADGRFVLVGSELRVAEGAVLDYEEQTTRDVRIEGYDLAGNTTTTTLTVQLNDVVEVFGGADGPELIFGDAGDNTINAGDGDDTIFGGAGDDTIDGGTGNDSINGGEGNDVLADAFGNDTMDGGAGDDFLYAVSGSNTLNGGSGNDLMIGGYGDDTMDGGAGNDVMRGDISTGIFGNDVLRGGQGDDLLEGGGGADEFIFATNDGSDTIGTLSLDAATRTGSIVGADFDTGVDRIVLDGFGYFDAAEAFSHVSDVNGVATFADQGTTITFAGLTVEDLVADDFLLIGTPLELL